MLICAGTPAGSNHLHVCMVENKNIHRHMAISARLVLQVSTTRDILTGKELDCLVSQSVKTVPDLAAYSMWLYHYLTHLLHIHAQ